MISELIKLKQEEENGKNGKRKSKKTGIEAKNKQEYNKRYYRKFISKYPNGKNTLPKREYDIKYYYETDYYTAINSDRKVGCWLRNNDLTFYKQILSKCPERKKKSK